MRKYYLAFSFLLAILILSGQGCLSLGGNSGSTTSGPAGMFVSTDKGETWNPISSLLAVDGVKQLTSVSVYRLIEDPQDSKGLYWASRSKGLLYSFDDGRSWKQSVAPLNTGFIYGIAIHPNNRCNIYAINGRQLFKTEDCVRSWEEMFQEARVSVSLTAVAFDPFPPHYIYMTESNGDVLQSKDGGENWSILKRFNVEIRDLVFDTNKQGLVYATSKKNGLYRSKDGGANWESLKEGLSNFPGANSYRRFLIYSTKAEQIYWISEYGVLTSKNAGTDWDVINLVTPPGSVEIYGFTVNPLNDKEIYYTGTIDNKSTFYRSLDGGLTWKTRKLPSKQLPTMLRAHPEKDGWIYLGYTIPPKK